MQDFGLGGSDGELSGIRVGEGEEMDDLSGLAVEAGWWVCRV